MPLLAISSYIDRSNHEHRILLLSFSPLEWQVLSQAEQFWSLCLQQRKKKKHF